jgi:hypothetical protein
MEEEEAVSVGLISCVAGIGAAVPAAGSASISPVGRLQLNEMKAGMNSMKSNLGFMVLPSLQSNGRE